MSEEFEQFTDEEITNILREALKVKINEKRKLPNKIQLNKALIATIGEFLSCFKLIGYDLDGNPINITAYKEKIEKSALDNAFMEEVSKFMETKMR
jgi:hypothetical protein